MTHNVSRAEIFQRQFPVQEAFSQGQCFFPFRVITVGKCLQFIYRIVIVFAVVWYANKFNGCSLADTTSRHLLETRNHQFISAYLWSPRNISRRRKRETRERVSPEFFHIYAEEVASLGERLNNACTKWAAFTAHPARNFIITQQLPEQFTVNEHQFIVTLLASRGQRMCCTRKCIYWLAFSHFWLR